MIQRLEEAQKTLVIRDLEDVLTEAHIFGVKHPQLEDHGAWVRFFRGQPYSIKLVFANCDYRITSHSRSSFGNSRGNLVGNRILYVNRLVHAYSTKH